MDSLERLFRSSHRLLPRNADDAVAVGFEDGLPGGVVVLRDRVVVPFVLMNVSTTRASCASELAMARRVCICAVSIPSAR